MIARSCTGLVTFCSRGSACRCCAKAARAASPQPPIWVARDLAYVCRHFRDSNDDPALKAAQARIVKARELVSRFPQMASLKALVAERTGHAGWQRLRPPLDLLPPAQVKELLADAAAFAATPV